MLNREYDCLIIGQGLAGSILAYSLIKRGLRIMVIDANQAGSSSRVAAGIINPITGHRFNLSENFRDYYAPAKTFYTTLEVDLHIRVFQAISQLRLIKNAGQSEHFQRRLQQRDYRDFLGKQQINGGYFGDTGFGSAEILQTGVVDTKLLLEQCRVWLQKQASYRSSEFDYRAIEANEQGWRYHDLAARHIIFCEGHQALKNPWLKDLPFKLAKGEILTLELSQGRPSQMLNWGIWLLPTLQARGRSAESEACITAKLGSNFDWNDLSLTPDPVTRTKLLAGLHQTTSIKGRLINTEVGIRPTTLRRKPFVGPLSKLNNAYCFNGFGSKGCLLMPYYAELFAQHLIERKPLPLEVTRWL